MRATGVVCSSTPFPTNQPQEPLGETEPKFFLDPSEQRVRIERADFYGKDVFEESVTGPGGGFEPGPAFRMVQEEQASQFLREILDLGLEHLGLAFQRDRLRNGAGSFDAIEPSKDRGLDLSKAIEAAGDRIFYDDC